MLYVSKCIFIELLSNDTLKIHKEMALRFRIDDLEDELAFMKQSQRGMTRRMSVSTVSCTN